MAKAFLAQEGMQKTGSGPDLVYGLYFATPTLKYEINSQVANQLSRFIWLVMTSQRGWHLK